MIWLRFFGSLKVSVLLLFLLFLTVLAGTLAQAAWGVGAVQTTLFSRAWFWAGGWWLPGLPFFLTLTGLNLLTGAFVHFKFTVRHLGLGGLHLSLALFCFASLGFSLAQEDLILGLVPGASSDRAFVKDAPGDVTRNLPFTLTVDSFRIETYAGSVEPSDYVSQVRIGRPGKQRNAEIRMNQPLRQDGWTIYQSSVQYVEGVPSPVFKLMHSPWAAFPYVVSTLLVLSFSLFFLLGRQKQGRPRV